MPEGIGYYPPLGYPKGSDKSPNRAPIPKANTRDFKRGHQVPGAERRVDLEKRASNIMPDPTRPRKGDIGERS